MNTMTLEEFKAELKRQDVPLHHSALKCPMCATVQSPTSLILAGVGNNVAEVQTHFGFSCVGRFTGAGAHRPGNAPGDGCDWTLGGFLRFHALEVIAPDGTAHPRFEIASAQEAKELMESHESTLQ